MEGPKLMPRNLYYTRDHEWIDFQGSVAYIGVCRFKLTGFKEIHNIEFREAPDIINAGEVIGTIRFDDYLINVHMPVAGKIISINDLLLTEEKDVLLQQPENNGWFALAVPCQLNDKTGLLSNEEYKVFRQQYKSRFYGA